MDLIQVIVVLAVVGLIVHLIITYLPMAEPFRKVIIAVVVIALCVWLLRISGLGNVTLWR